MPVRTRTNKKVYVVQIAKRTSANTWGDWIDITDYFLERVDDISVNIDTEKLVGDISQANCTFKFNNSDGLFNPEGTEGSLWNGTSEFMYHSRFRYWEFYEDEEKLSDGETPTILPLLDGLISNQPNYDGGTCKILVSSKLDILRDHYILEDISGKTSRLSGSPIMKFTQDVIDNNYSVLGITTNGAVLKKEIFYENMAAYSKSLLEFIKQISLDSGSMFGLRRDNDLIFLYISARSGGTIVFPLPPAGVTRRGLYYFLEGSGTTINNLQPGETLGDLVTLNSLSGETTEPNFQNWKAGFNYPKDGVDYSVRNWYMDLDGVAFLQNLEDYTVNLLIKFEKMRLPANSINSNPGVDANDFRLHPIFAWTTYNGADLRLTGNTSSEDWEGYFIDEDFKLVYARGNTVNSGSAPNPSESYLSVIDEKIVLCELLGEGFWEEITIYANYTDGIISVFLNGKLQGSYKSDSLGDVSYSLRKKILGCGFSYNNEFGLHFDNVGKVYYSAMTIEEGIPLGSFNFNRYPLDILNDFFGSTLLLDKQNELIIDDFDRMNLEKIVSYDTGERYIKNYMLSSDFQNIRQGFFTFYIDESTIPSFTYNFHFFIDDNSYFVSTGFTDLEDLAEQINSNTNSINNGLSARIVTNYEIGGTTYAKVIQLLSDGSTDYQKFSFMFSEIGVGTRTFDGEFDYEFIGDGASSAFRAFFPLMPLGENQLFVVKDDTSILDKGKRILEVKTNNTVTDSFEIKDNLKSVLDEKIRSRARMIIEIPFDQELTAVSLIFPGLITKQKKADSLDLVRIKLSYQNIDQFRGFKEGTHIKSWIDEGTYRYKDFWIVGIEHKSNGSSTRLKLMEKLPIDDTIYLL